MFVFGIEILCDEILVVIVEDGRKVLLNVIYF